MTDSDGDGRTNGEELGDPNCVWQKSNPTRLLSSVSHPGKWKVFHGIPNKRSLGYILNCHKTSRNMNRFSFGSPL